jgi:hypothetical protein
MKSKEMVDLAVAAFARDKMGSNEHLGGTT